MFSIEPIKKIKGLFSSYKNEQPVPAEEYNANIRCMQAAIEHNGQLLGEHSKAFESLSAEKLPDGAVQTELIADGAVTSEKLAPEIQTQIKTSAEALSSYFQDFLLQHHKSKPDMQGTFMNGSITAINKTLTRQTTYTKTVTHLAGGYLTIKDPNSDYVSDWIDVPYDNPATPASYKVQIPEWHPVHGTKVKGCGFSWLTRYVLDQAYDINTATDLFSAVWEYTAQVGGEHSAITGKGTCVVRLKDAAGNTLKTLPQTNAKGTTKPNELYRYQKVADITALGTVVIPGVRIIEIETSYTDYVYSSSGTATFKMTDAMQPTLTVNMRFGTGTTESMQYETNIPTANDLNYVAIGTYVKATTVVDFDTYKLNIAPYCIGTCPYQPAPGFETQTIAYINETADSEYSAELTDADAKRYYIRHNFQAPLIISARIKDNKPDDIQPDFIAGEYYSWPLHFADNSFIAYTNLKSTVEALKEQFSDYLEDITHTEYSLGSSQLGLQFNTLTNNLTVESVSVAKYAGLQKPDLT